MTRGLRVLVISLKRLGDVVLTTPALRRLSEAMPEAQIDFLVYGEFRSILEGNPYIHRLLVYPKKNPFQLLSVIRKEVYDWVIDFQATGSSAWACFLSRSKKRFAFKKGYPRVIHSDPIDSPREPLYCALKKIYLVDSILKNEGVLSPKGKENEQWRPQVFVSEAKLAYWLDVLRSAGRKEAARPLVMLSPTSRRLTRQWRLEGYAQVARWLAERHEAQVLCLWGPQERASAQRVVHLADHPHVGLAPQFTSLMDLAAFVSHADCLITNCNGTKHIAVARGVATVTIHMSSDPVSWNPSNPNGSGFHPLHPVVRTDNLWCIGCQKNVCPYSLECSSLLDPSLVYHQALEFLFPRALEIVNSIEAR